jgi:hypothetical protein
MVSLAEEKIRVAAVKARNPAVQENSMRFRVRSSGIQVIRSTPNPDGKGQKGSVVGNIPKGSLELKDKLKSALGRDEIKEVEDFIETYKNTAQLSAKLAAFKILDTVAEAVDYFKTSASEAEKDVLRSFFAQAVLELRAVPKP